jgi:hypothetical protein
VTVVLDDHLLVSTRDDGPGVRRCWLTLGIRYDALAR